MEEKRVKHRPVVQEDEDYPSVGTVNFNGEYRISPECTRSIVSMEDEMDPYSRAVEESSLYNSRRRKR